MPDATEVLTHFEAFLDCTGTVLTNGARDHLKLLMEAITGQDKPPGISVQDFLRARNDEERLALVASLFNYFAKAFADRINNGVPGYVKKLPAQLELAADFESLIACFETFVAATLNSLTPELCFGGKSREHFDIPMTASGRRSRRRDALDRRCALPPRRNLDISAIRPRICGRGAGATRIRAYAQFADGSFARAAHRRNIALNPRRCSPVHRHRSGGIRHVVPRRGGRSPKFTISSSIR
jgi:hypothetical protein